MVDHVDTATMNSGSIIVINGASCAGKTTLARAIQDLAIEPYIILSLDQFRDSLPSRYRGLNSPQGSSGAEGLNIVPITHDGRVLTDIQFGPYGQSVLRGMRRTIATLADEGLNVIVDDVILSSSFRDDYLQALRGLSVVFVGVHCNIEEMNRRERMREGRFPGTAESTLAKVHLHMLYDVEVDATHKPPTELAQEVLKCTSKPASPNALERMLSLKAKSFEPSESGDQTNEK